MTGPLDRHDTADFMCSNASKDSVEADMEEPTWNIALESRAWPGSEAMQRLDLLPAKLEMIRGKLLWSEEERVTLLAALLENVGALKAVQLGNPQVWRDAVAQLANS